MGIGALVGAAISGAFAYASVGVAGIAVFGIQMSALQFGIFSALSSLALSVVSQALTPKPPTANLGSFSAIAQGRNQQFRQAITAWDIVYGEIYKSGPLTFIDMTEDNKYLHMIITLASHPCEAVEAVFFNEIPIYLDDLDADGLVTAGHFSGKARIQWDLGTTGIQPFPDLVTESTVWTDAHRQEGMTKLYIRLEFSNDIYPTKIPNVRVRLKGKNDILDTRTSTSSWSFNSALCINDFMTLSNSSGGLGATATEINTTQLNASSNSCEEMVATLAVSHEILSVDTTNDTVDFSTIEIGSLILFQTGDRVQATTTDTLPAGLSLVTNYYTIIKHEKSSDDANLQIQFASTYANALTGTAIDLTDSGTGVHTITKNAEPRYTCSGVVQTDKKPVDILNDMRTSMAGRLIPISGEWYIVAGFWVSPTITFTEDNFVGPIQLQTKQSRRIRFNAIKGVYVNPLNSGQPSDYPIITNSVYEAEDNAERIFRELDLPYTTRAQTAQRIATIELQRNRRQISVTIRTNLSGTQVKATDTISLTYDRYGWTDKFFEIAQWSLVVEGSPPTLMVEMKLRESDSTVFNFDETSEETLVTPPPTTNLPNVLTVLGPGTPNVSESLYETRNGSGVKAKATLTWMASIDAFVLDYQAEWKLSSDSLWTILPRTSSLTIDVLDIAPGIYDFRVKALNHFEVSSAYQITANKEIIGLGAAPSPVTNLEIGSLSSWALLEWDMHPELDVKIGGVFKFRHSPEVVGASWSASTKIGKSDGYPGLTTHVTLPLKTGTYFIRAFDSLGTPGGISSITTTAARLLAFGSVSTVTEDSAFSGTHSGTFVGSSLLKLGGAGLFDDIPDLDLVSDLDFYGGINSSGTYTFASGIDAASIKNIRLTSHVKALIVNTLDLIDDRTSNIDDWDDFDGTASGSADAQVYVRTTDTDPTGSPVWSSWSLLTVGDFYNRAFQFQCRLTSDDASYNIYISELNVAAEELV